MPAPTQLFFDIETVPAGEELHGVVREVFAAAQAKRAKRAQANPTADPPRTEESFEDYLAKTGLSGDFGRIACLAYALDDGPPEVLWGDEREILEGFWKIVAARGVRQFIGHNIRDFDLPFVIKRSRIHGVKPTWMPSFARYRSDQIYDTMQEWSLWSYGQSAVSLDKLAKIFGLPTSKDAMDGSAVWPYYQAGRIEEICEYCKKDVVLTRQVYDKLTFGGTLPGG